MRAKNTHCVPTARFGACIRQILSFLTLAPGYLLPASEPATLSHCPDSLGMVTDAPFCGSLRGSWQRSSTAPNLLGSASKRADRHFPTLLSRSPQVGQQQTGSPQVPLPHNSERGALERAAEGELPCNTSKMIPI